jgi:ADP-ribose pyrophosphatase YjhB (NUDIX family)
VRIEAGHKLAEWAAKLTAMAQTGLMFSTDPYDRSRYASLLEIAAEMGSLGSGLDESEVARRLLVEDGYPTPKVDVRAFVRGPDHTTVLLVRERAEQRWTLPGGWAEVNESPAEATAREVEEEAGMAVEVRRLLALYDRRRHDHPPMVHHVYKVFFECSVVARDRPVTAPEIDAAEFFPRDALPPLSVERVTGQQLGRFFELAADPSIPTDFD